MRYVSSALVCLVVLAVPASADPRMDVLSAAMRCNAITDPRVWLDCYYGAAQPLRAQLGLSPAPAAQVRLVPPASGSPVAVPSPPLPAAAPPQRSAAAILGPERDYAPPQRMASYRFDDKGLFTVTLADGSIWKQNQEDSVKARWRAPAESYVATVVPGMLGSHLMRVSDKHSYRVRQVP